VELAKLKNVCCKLGAVEEWGVSDPLQYMNFAIATFGFDRVLYESNWFVLEVLKELKYDTTAKIILDALCSQNATQEDMNAVCVK
jgi:predicted TIM-barrel fold metal-dependent hydrolase